MHFKLYQRFKKHLSKHNTHNRSTKSAQISGKIRRSNDFAWAHRGPGNMLVWIPNEIEHAK